MIVYFTIPGVPKGKGRPKFSKRGQYTSVHTPEETVLYENLVKTEYIRQCGKVRFGSEDALRMEILAFFAIPNSVSIKKKSAMTDGIIRPTKKPDADNILKIIADSLNEIAYKDDAKIVETIVKKYYGDVPEVIVTITNEWEE